LLYIKFFSRKNLLGESARLMLLGVFVVSKVEAAAIRAAFNQGGEFAAAVELRLTTNLIPPARPGNIQRPF
jgi:hypothetical protein